MNIKGDTLTADEKLDILRVAMAHAEREVAYYLQRIKLLRAEIARLEG